jgi:glycosyltransferase involved in cell wall biosynthesis
MHLSVIICSRNRLESLVRAVHSIAESRPTLCPGDWELLVVDNSDDHNAVLALQKFKSALPLRVMHEPRPGLSNARNAGAQAAQGTWLLWTDDDVIVEHGWLAGYAAAILQYPEARAFGGPIIPVFEGSPPDWLTEGYIHLRSAFASREPNDVPQSFGAKRPLPYGANFAIRRTDALKFPFNPSLGRHPNQPMRGSEETEVLQQILSKEDCGRWLRNASVSHYIDPSRQTMRYVRAYYRDVGYLEITLANISAVPRLTL